MGLIHIVIFASGSGTNAENIIRYFKGHRSIVVDKVLTNNPEAGVIERAKKLGVGVDVFSKQEFHQEAFLQKIQHADFIILAGFLWLGPEYLVLKFAQRILNIHPALLPQYGGKGMYGMKVHEAVIESGEKESGITIHEVNSEYDKGAIVAQFKCPVHSNDTPEKLAQRIHELEYEHFPETIESFILN